MQRDAYALQSLWTLPLERVVYLHHDAMVTGPIDRLLTPDGPSKPLCYAYVAPATCL